MIVCLTSSLTPSDSSIVFPGTGYTLVFLSMRIFCFSLRSHLFAPHCHHVLYWWAILTIRTECCVATPTVTVPGACAKCQTGCATDLTTVTVTEGAAPLSYNPGGPQLPPTKRQGGPIIPCTSTLSQLKHFTHGPTKTLFPSTVTDTSSVDCAGCGALSVQPIGGVGPAVIFTTTVKADVPTTTTAFVCSTTPA